MKENFWKYLPTPSLILAPMVGITNSAFRHVCKRWGADVVYSEMISADALVRSATKATAMLAHTDYELPLVVQLMGKDPHVLAHAARIAVTHGASGIDINFGCPAHKIARNECGVMLMRQPELCKRLIAAVIDAVEVPVSIKVRVSIKNNVSHNASPRTTSITVLDMLDTLHDLPIAAIMVHGRSFEDSFHGEIRTGLMAQVKRRFVTGPVIANGGITTIESSREILEATSADGLGLARSVIGKPWIFKQMHDYLNTGSYSPVGWDIVKETILLHVNLFEMNRGNAPFREIRKHLTHYVHGHKKASVLRQKLCRVESAKDVEAILNKY